MLSATKCVLPSTQTIFTPPLCRLDAVVAPPSSLIGIAANLPLVDLAATLRVRRHDVVVTRRRVIAVHPVASAARELIASRTWQKFKPEQLCTPRPRFDQFPKSEPIAGNLDDVLVAVAENQLGIQRCMRRAVRHVFDLDGTIGDENAVVLLDARHR